MRIVAIDLIVAKIIPSVSLLAFLFVVVVDSLSLSLY